MFNIRPYYNKHLPCIFFGIYDQNDQKLINNHREKCFIMIGGSDFPRFKYFIADKVTFLSISEDIRQRFEKQNQHSIQIHLNLVDKNIFGPRSSRGSKIFIYDGIRKKADNAAIYGKKYYDEVCRRLPNQQFIFSSDLNVPYEKMPSIYAQCCIGLRLTEHDGNANTVQEMEAMGIPVVHNHSDYGLKWKNVDDIVRHIGKFSNEALGQLYNEKADCYDNIILNNKILSNINSNIDNMKNFLKSIKVKNILFICADYPGYGGAATNCDKLSTFFSQTFNTYSVYWNYQNETNKKFEETVDYKIVDQNQLNSTLHQLKFKPDIIILKSALTINLKSIFKRPIIFLIPGIYRNHLDKHYLLLRNKQEHNKYINHGVIQTIKMVDYSFCNSLHTKKILHKVYGLYTGIFYSSFIPYYQKKIEVDKKFEERKYEYGLIVSNFDRKIKNAEKSIEFLKGKENVILIGKNSSKYKEFGFECVDLVDKDKMTNYYKQIKYIVQNSFFESCSNVKIESLYNGCKIYPNNVVVSSTQYPGYGGAATNAYQIIKFLRQNAVNTAGVFFHDTLKDINYDPENIGGIFLYNFKNYNENQIINDVKSYLKTVPNYCLAKNYRAPYICKKIFKCYTVYLVSGINHFMLEGWRGKSAEDILHKDFTIDYKIPDEIKCNTLCDKIVINSKLSYDIFNKIYSTFQNKICPSILDTANYINIQSKFIDNSKEFDIVIACSQLDRLDKNNIFLIEILKNSNFDKYKKIIIGSKFDKFIDIPNTQCVGLCEQIHCIEYISKSKVLLFPSLFDSNSNTIREAIYYKCLPLITKNIGFYEAFPDFLICKSYTNKEWSSKLLYILENYSNVKDTQFNFNTGENIIDFLKKN